MFPLSRNNNWSANGAVHGIRIGLFCVVHSRFDVETNGFFV
ncbi:hypothetical protein CLOSTMETH_01261 [[Clostridium] methylpentosum DSM 5476]|uniref:Uncharacterized protein n=1 Tax=[Clostridium] methylpentosum DSM 5476 TaxID=537013 RepID=C0EBP3_9FIRM|nr:hypothetical protein CLOSTMETH_01261 [[Clostridium] methylpentosum DSM 5476]